MESMTTNILFSLYFQFFYLLSVLLLFKTGFGSKDHSEFIHQRAMLGRESNRDRRLLRAKGLRRSCGGGWKKWGPSRGDKAHTLRLLLPKEWTPHIPRRLPPHKGSYAGQWYGVLGDHHREQHRRLPGRWWHPHCTSRAVRRNGVPVRGALDAA